MQMKAGGWQQRDSKDSCGGAELRRRCSWYTDREAGVETSFKSRMRKWPARKAKVTERGLFCGTQHLCRNPELRTRSWELQGGPEEEEEERNEAAELRMALW